ncbi:MAG: tetratricopeptide repeat protein [Verrucomicrobiota bacterium]
MNALAHSTPLGYETGVKKARARASVDLAETPPGGGGGATTRGKPSKLAPVEKRKNLLLGALLLAATVAAYQPVWHAGFIWDDDAHVTRAALRSWTGLGSIWMKLGATQQYYPLVHTVFWLEHRLWGDAPLGYHLTNVALHVASALLLVGVLRRLEIPGAWLAAFLFALHPVQVESVAWVSELKNTLSAVCCLGSALAYLRFDWERKRVFYLVSFGLFAAGLLAKTVIATLPAALLLVLWWRRKKLRWKKDVGPLGPFFIAGIGMGLLTAWVERTQIIGQGFPETHLSHLSLVERWVVPGRAVWFYLGKLVWPHPLVFIYPRWEIHGADGWQYVYPAGAVLLGAGLWAWRRRLGDGPLVALLFFAGTLFPALGFFDVYPFRFSFVADHFQYLACLGPLALAAAGMERGLGWMAGPGRAARVLVCAAALTALGAVTWHQCGMYADEETLWRVTLARNPGCWLAHNNLGWFYLQKGEVEKGIGQFREALEIKPDYLEARNNLGWLYLQKGDLDAAIAQYHRALEIEPDCVESRDNLGGALFKQGKLDEGIAQYRRVLELDPNYAGACYDLGFALEQKGDLKGAIAQYRKDLETDPHHAEARKRLGFALLKEGEVGEAIAQYHQALELTPGDAEIRNNLGSALVQQGKVDEAMAQYRLALETQPNDAGALGNLGNALLLKGDGDAAIACFQKATAINPDQEEAWYDLGNGFLQKGNRDEAIASYRRAIKINPRQADAYGNLGVALSQKGEIESAMDAWQQALEIKPDQPAALNNLAWSLATAPDASLRNGAKAVALAAQANELSGGGSPAVLHTLAAAYAEAGSYGMAATTARRALELAVEQKNDALAATLQTEIKLYEAGTPVREGKQ